VKLVEQELWQREEKGLIGVLPVHDSEAAGSLLSPGVGSDSGEGGSKAPGGSAGESTKQDTKNGKETIHWHSRCVTLPSLLICVFPYGHISEQDLKKKFL
jgi:ATP-dependent Lon protease